MMSNRTYVLYIYHRESKTTNTHLRSMADVSVIICRGPALIPCDGAWLGEHNAVLLACQRVSNADWRRKSRREHPLVRYTSICILDTCRGTLPSRQRRAVTTHALHKIRPEMDLLWTRSIMLLNGLWFNTLIGRSNNRPAGACINGKVISPNRACLNHLDLDLCA